jgi:type IV secretory pathway VirB10-like protein
MTASPTPDPVPVEAPPALSHLEDHRTPPSGLLPRRIQAWLMAGLAFVIVLVILVTGRTQPLPVQPAATPPRQASPASPAAVEQYARTLDAHDATRSRPSLTPLPAISPAAGSPTPPSSNSDRVGRSRLEAADPQPSRLGQSLFADNVVSSRRPAPEQPTPDRSAKPEVAGGSAAARASAVNPLAALSTQFAELQQLLAQGSATSHLAVAPAEPEHPAERAVRPPATPDSRQGTGASEPKPKPTDSPADGPRLRLFEGTVIETVLMTRLNGSLAGPVTCLVTTPVYSEDRQHLLIPAGARLLGASSPVQAWGDSRLAVSFHRLLMPDGHTYSLEAFRGLDQVGETGVTESVNRHYLQVFGASLAIGAISGLAQVGTTSGLASTSFGDEYRQAAGASLASSTGRVLDRYLNVLPTITIREGYRIKVYLTNDFELPAYAAEARSGGLR